MFPGSWRQIPRIKSEAGGIAGKGPARRITKPGRQCHAEMVSKEFGVQARITAPLCPPPTAAGIRECRGRGMSTFPKHVHRSRWTPGSRRLGGTAQIFGRPPEPRAPAPLSHHKTALSIKKGRMATLRTAAITPRESERAATARALFRVLPKWPATLPGPRFPVGDKPPPYLFVAERCDPWLPFVELLLEVAVLRRHRGTGSAWSPGGVGGRRTPSPASPPPNAWRTRPTEARPNFPGPLPSLGPPCNVARSSLPVAAASLGQLPGRGGGRGHPAARPEPCKFAGRGAGASECKSVCRGRGDEQRAK